MNNDDDLGWNYKLSTKYAINGCHNEVTKYNDRGKSNQIQLRLASKTDNDYHWTYIAGY